jgi:very-short-patch-repair endonuclease
MAIACLGAKMGACGSHRAAALIHKLDGVTIAPLEVTVPHGAKYARRDVLVHRSADLLREDWSLVGGIPVTTPTRTIVDLAAVCSLDAVERAFECAVRTGATSVGEVEATAVRIARPGRPGAAAIRELLRRLERDGKCNGSDLETRFFQLLRAAGIRLPLRQRRIVRPDGSVAFADYAYDDLRAIIELEGFDSHSSKRQHRSDIERNNDLVREGWVVLRFSWRHVTRDADYVIATLLATFPELLV